MIFKIIYTAIVLFVVVQEITGERCTPGETKQVECNRCRCLADGRGFACTRRFCLPEERHGGHRVKRQAGECYPGQVRQIDCNSCRCVRGGAWACTRRACLKQRNKRDLSVAPDLLTTPCAPDDYFKLDCNTCYCKDDRSGYLCTENFCNYADVSTSKRPVSTNSTTNSTTSSTSTTTTEKVVTNDDVAVKNSSHPESDGLETTTSSNDEAVETTTVFT